MPTPANTALLLDVMLGKLATYLRICGYDTTYALDCGLEADDELRTCALESGRVLVTRDRELARTTEGAIELTSREVNGQLSELLAVGFSLSLSDPVRCSICNGPLQRVEIGETTPSYAPSPGERKVWRCSECDQCFWRGSHWEEIERTLDSIGA